MVRSAERRSPVNCDNVSNRLSDDEENFSDSSTFESEMSQFKLRLKKQRQLARRFKMRPNVSPRWLDSVTTRLDAAMRGDNGQSFTSPRVLVIGEREELLFNGDDL